MNQNGHKEPKPRCVVPDCPSKAHEESKHTMCWKHSEGMESFLFYATKLVINGVPIGAIAEAAKVVMAQMQRQRATPPTVGPGGLILPPR